MTDIYMYNIMCVSQVDLSKKHQVVYLFLQALKEVFPTVYVELKNSVSLNKAFQGDGNW